MPSIRQGGVLATAWCLLTLAATNAGPINNLPSCQDTPEQHCYRPFQDSGDLLTLEAAPAEEFAEKPRRWDVLPGAPAWNATLQAEQRVMSAGSDSLALCSMMGNEFTDDVVEWLQYHWCAPCGKRTPQR